MFDNSCNLKNFSDIISQIKGSADFIANPENFQIMSQSFPTFSGIMYVVIFPGA